MKTSAIVLFIAALFPVLNATTSEAANAPSTNHVWQHHIQAWSDRDLDGIVSDYSQDSFLVVNGRTYFGRDEIRSVFRRLFEIFNHGNSEIDPVVLKDRTVFITWHFTPLGEAEVFGTDTFLIENGVIAVQTIASPLYEVQPEKI